MKRARSLAASDGITEAQAFARIAESDPSAFAKAKRPPKQGKPDVDPDDDDDLDDAQPDDDVADATDLGHDGIGARPFEGASGDGNGRSTDYGGRTYVDGDNAAQVPEAAAAGAVEGSYDPRRRPASATKPDFVATERGSLSARQAQRYAKFLAKSPSGNHNDAMWFARASKEQRRRYKASRRAA